MESEIEKLGNKRILSCKTDKRPYKHILQKVLIKIKIKIKLDKLDIYKKDKFI